MIQIDSKTSTNANSTETTLNEKINLDEIRPVSRIENDIETPPPNIDNHKLSIKGQTKHFNPIRLKRSHSLELNLFKAIVIRLLFIAQSLFYIIYIICQTDSVGLCALGVLLLVIVIDGVYVCIKRYGRSLKPIISSGAQTRKKWVWITTFRIFRFGFDFGFLEFSGQDPKKSKIETRTQT